MSSSGKRQIRQSTTSQANGFEQEEWFHGMLPREDITKLLVDQGHFLVRMTEPKPNQGMKLVLSVKWNKKPHHFIINHDGKEASKYYIERFQFDSVIDLINFYISRKVPVTEKSGACLIHPVPRQDWELYHESIELGKMLGEGKNFCINIC
uniref:SH2 domain-containing protein n=1 Tax=Panagrolaimus superbus TaxID=310955 RepID=A0A914YBL1_9BILA